MPPATAAITNSARTTIGSTPRRRAKPAQTPPRRPRSLSRRSGGAAAEALTAVMVAPSSAAFEPGRDQDGPEPREDGRRRVAEPEVDRAELVDEQQDAEPDRHEPGDQRGAVDALHRQAANPSKPARSTRNSPTPTSALTCSVESGDGTGWPVANARSMPRSSSSSTSACPTPIETSLVTHTSSGASTRAWPTPTSTSTSVRPGGK